MLFFINKFILFYFFLFLQYFSLCTFLHFCFCIFATLVFSNYFHLWVCLLVFLLSFCSLYSFFFLSFCEYEFLCFCLINVAFTKCLGRVNKGEVDVFLKLSCFFCDPTDVANLISGSCAFAKSSLTICTFSVHVLLKPGLENFKHYFTRV